MQKEVPQANNLQGLPREGCSAGQRPPRHENCGCWQVVYCWCWSFGPLWQEQEKAMGGGEYSYNDPLPGRHANTPSFACFSHRHRFSPNRRLQTSTHRCCRRAYSWGFKVTPIHTGVTYNFPGGWRLAWTSPSRIWFGPFPRKTCFRVVSSYYTGDPPGCRWR